MSDDLEAVRRQIRTDRFATVNGIVLLELKPGFARTEMKIDERHLNSVGTVQGGALFTLADYAFGAACNTSGRATVAVNMNLSCMKATRSGTLTATATEIARGRRITTCTVEVTNSENELVAFFQGTGYILDVPYPPDAAESEK